MNEEAKKNLRDLLNTDPNSAIAYVIMEHVCTPHGFGERSTWSEATWFDAADSSIPYDGTLEDVWPWVAKNVLHTVTTLERNDRLRVDVWTTAKTGELAGTPDLVLPVTSFNCRPKGTANLGTLRANIDLKDAVERIEAHVRLFGRVPAERILAVWRWANELAAMGEVVGHTMVWNIEDGYIVHSMDGVPVTRRHVTQLNAPWAEITQLHAAARGYET